MSSPESLLPDLQNWYYVIYCFITNKYVTNNARLTKIHSTKDIAATTWPSEQVTNMTAPDPVH